mmetsp:Transcript_41505/g.93593  ORF Transcript_41505/g.93593 Transcript_41505/m.93593 type:complete len:354 (+) Transcript_41505:41-1102(+)
MRLALRSFSRRIVARPTPSLSRGVIAVSRPSELVGNTPLIYLDKCTEGIQGRIVGKLESLGPCSSVKDRLGRSMIDEAERAGLIKPGMTLVEPTSGNTGIALAFIARERGYKCVLTMPETMSVERRMMLLGLGAEARGSRMTPPPPLTHTHARQNSMVLSFRSIQSVGFKSTPIGQRRLTHLAFAHLAFPHSTCSVGGADSQGDGGGGRPRQSQGNPRPTWRPGLHASAVREPCQSQGAPRDDGPRDLARHGGRRGGVRERRRDGRHGHGGLAVHQGLPRARNRAKEPKPLHGGGGAGGANALDGGARRGEDRGARAAQNPGHGRRNRPASARPRSRGRGGPGAQRGGDGHDL